MAKKTSILPALARPNGRAEVQVSATLYRQATAPKLGLWIIALIAVAVLIVVLVSSATTYWIKNVQSTANPTTPLPLLTTFKVQRTASYVDLDMTVINAQYATYFPEDHAHAGPAIVRLNMKITNTTKDQINVVFYDSAHLLIPSQKPIAPTTVNLSVGPQPGSSETGWIDFPVPNGTRLDTLTLQLGSITLNETMVKIPFTGAFNPENYAHRLSPQDATFNYNFNGHILNYHLTSVDIRYSYQGSQCKADQQFYVLNFRVDNPNGMDISPGFGFDYVRLLVNGYGRPPVNNTLPYTFKAGATGVGGHVVFMVPAGMKSFTVGFLSQNGSGEQGFGVSVL